MDPSPHQNWLAFSLSNYSHQLSLFQNNPSGAVTNENESATNHLPLLIGADGAPKLEDFLGGSGGDGASADGVTRFDGGSNMAQFSDHAALVQYDDLELKNIAASFLHGYKNVEEGHMQLAVVAPPEPPAKKAV